MSTYRLAQDVTHLRKVTSLLFSEVALRTEPAVAHIILFISLKAVYQCGVPRGSREQSLRILGGYKGRGNKKAREVLEGR